jgi:hypothetical protein
MTFKNKEPYSKKPLYCIPYSSSKYYYIVILKKINLLYNNIYIVKKIKNLYSYLSKNNKENLILIKYYEIENFDMSLLNDYKKDKCIFKIDDIETLYSVIEQKYGVVGKYPSLNLNSNKLIECKFCKFFPYDSEELLAHLYNCETYRYTLFGLDVPKHLQPSKKSCRDVNVTFNTTNNYTYVNYRMTGDYIRANISDDDKVYILNSMDKLGEMMKRHFQFPEIAGNIRVKNISPYGTCEVFNGSDFVVQDNKDAFRYYIQDHLDSMDYMAYALKDDRVTRNLEKYDNNIRNNDQNMNKCIKKTIKTFKYMSAKNSFIK